MMHTLWRRRPVLAVGISGLALGFCARAGEEPAAKIRGPLVLHARTQEPAATTPGSAARSFRVVEKTLRWEPARTAIIICDMWNQHWCQGASRRVAQMAPVMNQTIAAARARGVLIIHAPSSCMDAYKDHPARRRALAAPTAANLPADIAGGCDKIPAEEQGIYPIDQSDGGCDDGPQCPQGSPWKSQISAIEIRDEDAISDSGTEIWNLLESRGITNVMLMGVHTNMCVLGRPFGLRQMVRHGRNTILVRDLTDTMYNSRCWPYVSHHEGTNRIIQHIQRYVAATIASSDLTGRPAFHFEREARPRIVFLIGEDEYKTEVTLPAFARTELEPLGMRCTFVSADPKTPHGFPGVEALDDADLLLLSVRRRAPATDQMTIIRRYLASGKPLVGIRTACHAFDIRGQAPAGHVEWKSFDSEILGGHYTGHFPDNLHPQIVPAAKDKPHQIIRDIETPFESKGSLYKTSPLATGAQALLLGKIAGHPAEPVAWVKYNGSGRVFYTSLGHPGDFENASFRRMLRNAVFWAFDRQPTQATRDIEPPPARTTASGAASR
jgi:nicotinamidase-related amidase/type 1 glutamine amidotransferase